MFKLKYIFLLGAFYFTLQASAQSNNTTFLGSTFVPGKAFDITLSGRYAYTVSWDAGASFNVLDILSPAQPVWVSSFNTVDSYGITIEGDYAFVADGVAGIRILNISNPLYPYQIGYYDTPGTARDVKVRDNYLYVADQMAGLRILDISNISDPVEVGYLDTSGWTFDVELRGKYAFLADHFGGLRVVDISDPANPIEVSAYSTSGEVIDIEFKDNLAFFTDGYEGLWAVDITDPLNIQFVGSISSPFWFLGLKIEGDYAYVAAWEFGGLRVFNIADPSNMKEVGYFVTAGKSRDLAVRGNYIYVADWNPGVKVIRNDLLMPQTNTTPLGDVSVLGRSFDVTISNNIAFVVSWFDSHLQIVNVKDPSNPVTLSSFPTTDSYGVTVYGNFAFIADGSDGLRIIDVTDLQNPIQVSHYNLPGTARDVKIAGNYAYLAGQTSGLRVVDISDISNPVEVGYLDTPGSTFDIEIKNNYAFLADHSGGLRVVDISDPTNPTEVNVYNTPGDVIDIDIKDNNAIFTDGFEGLRVVDISDPLNIHSVGRFSSPFWFLGLQVEGNFAYVAAWEYGGLRIIDITDLTNMTEVGYYITPGNSRDLFVKDGISYIADWDTGLRIVKNDLFNPIPVELVSFTANRFDKKIQLSWITATEINNQGFEIERKFSNQKDWKEVGFVEGNGTTTEIHHYSYEDDISDINGINNIFYRLKQVDFNGTYEYSDEIEVVISNPESFSLQQNYPNPFNPSTKIKYQIADAGFVSLRVYDVLGNEVATLINKEMQAGSYEVEFDASNLPSGIYYYTLKAGEFAQTRKMILLK